MTDDEAGAIPNLESVVVILRSKNSRWALAMASLSERPVRFAKPTMWPALAKKHSNPRSRIHGKTRFLEVKASPLPMMTTLAGFGRSYTVN